jgi:hypothetical protein
MSAIHFCLISVHAECFQCSLDLNLADMSEPRGKHQTNGTARVLIDDDR